MSIFEYDEEKTKKAWIEIGEARGMERGMELGMEQGTQRLLNLIAKMSETGEADSISRLSEDAAFLQEMYERYSL